jgi:hypothetical protein
LNFIDASQEPEAKRSLDHETESCGSTSGEDASSKLSGDGHRWGSCLGRARGSRGSRASGSTGGGCAGAAGSGRAAAGGRGSVFGRVELSAVCLLGIVASLLRIRIARVVGLALGVKLFAKEGWHGVDVVLEAGSTAVCTGAVDNQGRSITAILSSQRRATAEFRAGILLRSAPLSSCGQRDLRNIDLGGAVLRNSEAGQKRDGDDRLGEHIGRDERFEETPGLIVWDGDDGEPESQERRSQLMIIRA